MRPYHPFPLLLAIFAAAVSGVASASAHAPGVADDINTVPLLSTGTYDPRSEQGRGLKELFGGIGAAITGPGTDLAKTIRDKLDDPALRAYFPDPAERARIAQALGGDAKRRYLSNGYTNGSVDAAMKYLTDRLVGTIIVRVLMKEGVKDVNRAGAWADKIVAPFDRCVRLTVSVIEAKKCSGPLENDLMKNIGLALSYELTRQEFAAPKTAPYLKCVRPADPGVNDRVRECALESVRSAASGFGRNRVLEEAKKLLPPASASAIAGRAMPAFNQCLRNAHDRAGFSGCGDGLLISAGSAIAQEAIRLDPRVVDALPDQAARERLALQGSQVFSRCMNDNLKGNHRDAAGNLNLDNCQRAVTGEITLAVAEAKMRSAVKDQISDPATVDRLAATLVRKDFAACIGPAPAPATLDACTLKLEKGVAFEAARVRLTPQVDKFFADGGGMQAYGVDDRTRQTLIDGVLSGHQRCLDAQVKHASTADAAITACFKATIRDLSLRLGALELSKTAKENRIDPGTDDFKKLSAGFQDELGACLDRRKDPAFPLDAYLDNLARCHTEVAKTTTSRVARSELASTVQGLLGDAGADVQKQLLADFDACLAKAGKPAETDACVAALKASATITLAKLGVHQRAASELSVPEAPPSILALDATLDACVAGGKKPADDCTIAYVKDATKEIGHLKLDGTIRPIFGDARMAKLAAELAKLEGPFKSCVDAPPPPLDAKMLKAFEACGNTLTDDAMAFLLAHQDDDAPPPAAAPAEQASVGPGKEQLTDMMGRTLMCLNGTLEPGEEDSLRNLEPGSLEEKLLKLIGTTVSYDVKNAGGRYEEVLAGVADELQAAGPGSARRKLVSLIVQKGLADQLLKAMVKQDLENTLRALPEGRKLPDDIAAKLTDKATLDQALGEEALAKLRPLLEAGVLQPVLADGKALDSTPVLRAFRSVRAQAVEALLASPVPGLDDAAKQKVREALQP